MYIDFTRKSGGFYTYRLTDDSLRWGYNKSYRGNRRHRDGFVSRTRAARDFGDWCAKQDALAGNASRLTVRQLCEEWLAHGGHRVKASSTQGYRADLENRILPLVGDVSLRELGPAHLAELQRQLSSTPYRRGAAGAERLRGPRAVNRIMASLSAALGYAADMRYISAPPRIRRLPERPKERRFLSAAEAGKMLDACEGRDQALIATALGTGSRRGEVLGLRWEETDLEAGTCWILRTVDTKGELGTPKDHQSRPIVVPEWLRLLLLDYWRACGSPTDGWVFPGDEGPLSGRHAYEKVIRPARVKAGIPDVDFYGLRHSFATLQLAGGAIPHAISEQLGHSTTSTTHRFYAHYLRDTERIRRELDSWEPTRNLHGNENEQKAGNDTKPLVDGGGEGRN